MNAKILAFVALVFFSGCTAAGDYIAGSSIKQDPAIQYPPALDHIIIGVTTQDEIRQFFGNPTDLQTSAANGRPRESWSYAVTEPPIHPLQYIPFAGALALPKPPKVESFSVSFSEQGVVEGISLWKVQPYNESGTYLLFTPPYQDIHPYGLNNPLARHGQ